MSDEIVDIKPRVNFGWLPDIPDYRDRPYRALQAPLTLPERVDLRDNVEWPPSLADQVAGTQWQSHEARRNIGFAADMEDYYKQKDKMRRRAALDTYGQFSKLSKYAPGYTAAPPVDPVLQ